MSQCSGIHTSTLLVFLYLTLCIEILKGYFLKRIMCGPYPRLTWGVGAEIYILILALFVLPTWSARCLSINWSLGTAHDKEFNVMENSSSPVEIHSLLRVDTSNLSNLVKIDVRDQDDIFWFIIATENSQVLLHYF